MAARKKTTRKKTATKKKAAKKAPKRKAAPRKKTAAKKGAKKRASKKRPASLGARTRKAIDSNLRTLERELPRHLKSLLGEIRKGIAELEDQIEKARGDGEKRWNDLEKQVRQDSEKMLKRFGIGSKKKKTTKKSSRKKTSRKKSAPRKKAAKKRARR